LKKNTDPSLQGFILLDKPESLTSRQCVDVIQKAFNGAKAGHAGTLDPFATGLLPVCIGRATKLVDFLRGTRKTYVAAMTLGIGTDTQDLTGDIIERKNTDPAVTEETVCRVMDGFRGIIQQVPPMHSAVKINGTRLYELARKKIEVQRKPRPVNIYDLHLLHWSKMEIRFSVTCSEGTYIRTLGVDIARELGTTGTLKSLRRIQVGRYSVEQATTLDDFNRLAGKQRHSELLRPTEQLTAHLPVHVISAAGAGKFKNGGPLTTGDFIDWEDTGEKQWIFNVFTQSGKFLGLAEHIGRDRFNNSILKTARLIDIW
jgi:tRNA pseudouridine55 synthase